MTAPKGISETQVREILARLIPVYHPMEVYLFGSRAWGTPQADSDVDLLVVVESAAVDKAERLRLGTRALLGMGIDIDLLVFTAAEVHAKGAHPSTIIHKVLTQESGCMKPHEEWLFKAGHDLESARILSAAEPPMLDIAVYHAQQCAEKAFKAIFCFHGQEVPRTHNLPLLLEKCAELDRRIGSLIDDAVFLNPYATLYRYPDGELMPTVAETEKAIAAARRALAAAQELTR